MTLLIKHIASHSTCSTHTVPHSSSVCFEGESNNIYLPLTSRGPHFLPLLLSLGLSVHPDAKTGK